jgi:hypothetical protein
MADDSGGTKLLRLNETNAFLTGKKPGDCKFLKPRIKILTSNFSTFTLFLRSTLFASNIYLKSNSVYEKDTSTSPDTGSSGENLIGCHLGILGISLLVLSSVQFYI